MVDKELIGIWRNELKPAISLWLLNTNYEEMGEQDKEEFERDFDEILDLALIGLKHKAQLSQEGTTKDATSDTISRQAAIDALNTGFWGVEWDKALATAILKDLPSAQPVREKGEWIEASVAGMPAIHHEKCGAFVYAPNGKKGFNFCPVCGADMRGERNG